MQIREERIETGETCYRIFAAGGQAIGLEVRIGVFLFLLKRVQKEGEHNWQQIAAIKVERGDESVSGANYRQNPLVLQHLAHFCQMWDTFAKQGTLLHQATTTNTQTGKLSTVWIVNNKNYCAYKERCKKNVYF